MKLKFEFDHNRGSLSKAFGFTKKNKKDLEEKMKMLIEIFNSKDKEARRYSHIAELLVEGFSNKEILYLATTGIIDGFEEEMREKKPEMSVEVKRIRKEDLPKEVQEVMGRMKCPCPSCTAKREAKAKVEVKEPTMTGLVAEVEEFLAEASKTMPKSVVDALAGVLKEVKGLPVVQEAIEKEN